MSVHRPEAPAAVVVEGVRIEGRGRDAVHDHGGPPAWIGGASFVVVNRRDEPVVLTLEGTRWLVAFSGEPPHERARPKPAGIALEPELVDGTMTVVIPAGSTKIVTVGHEVQEAYTVWGDRFATVALFDIGGVRVEVLAEHRVVRRWPLRGG